MSAIPGPYSVALGLFEDPDSEALTLKTLKYGYDSAEEAHSSIPELAKEGKYDPDDLFVYQIIEKK